MSVLFRCLLLFSCLVTVSEAACGLVSGISCDNGGTCSGGQCQCQAGYTGDICEFAIDFQLTADTSYQESQGTAAITVSRSLSGFTLGLSVSATGTATLNDDFRLSATNIQFQSGDTSVTVTITFVDDEMAENDETITLTLTASDGTSSASTYTIQESDPVTLAVQGLTTFSENSGTAVITFGCTVPTDTPSASFTVTAAHGSATGADYSFTPSPPYTCTSSQTFTVTVNLLTDNTPETDEQFSLAFTSTLPFTGLTGSSVDVTITDDDAVQISLSLPDEVSEGSADINFASPVTNFVFVNGEPAPVTITVTVSGVTAVLNTDFELSDPSGVVTFTYDQSVPASRQNLDNFQIRFRDDNTLEPDKTFTVTFTSDYVLSGTTTKTVTIKDDELESMSLSGPITVSEDQGLAAYTLTRTVPFRAITVTYSATAAAIDTSIYNTNVQDTTGTVDFGIGDLNKQFAVSLVDDSLIQTIPKTFTVSASGDRITAVSDLVVTITEDDSYTVSFGAVTVTEGDNITVTFRRDITAGALTIDVTTADDSAEAVSDYTARTETLEFGDGAGTVTLTIQTLEDEIYEDSETLTVSITSSSIALNAASTSSATMTIDDNNVETLTITGGGNVNENGGPVTLTITRTATFAQLVVMADTVIPATSGNVPITADDITIQTNVQLTFPIGTDSVTFTVAITGDTTAEPDEDFQVTIDAPDPIVNVSAVVTIVNDDPDVVTLTSFLALLEDGETKDITATRTVSDKEVTVQVNTNDVSAKAGTDYTALTNHDVTFAVGSLTTTFSVAVQNDEDEEDDETFTLVVSGDTVITTDAYTFKIVDDEGSRPFDCRRNNQDCQESTDVCHPDVSICECKGTPAREGDMCNIITEQKNGAACSNDCNNHGVCLDNSGSTSCACYPGYYGENCEQAFLQAVCTSEHMTLIANPHGDFAGFIYVKGKSDISACNATDVPDPPLKGLTLTVRHDSTACEVITPQEDTQTNQTSYSRRFRIQYDPLITTGLDQCLTVTCSFDRNNVLVNGGVVTIDPNGPFIEESAGNQFSPLTLAVDIDGTPVTESTTVVLARILCVTIRIPEDFGGLEIIDIDFNNTLPTDPLTWRVYTSGCPESKAVSVLIKKPFYPESGNRRAVKFCFYAFAFANSFKLTVQIKVKVCVDPDYCQLGTCSSRRKRQVVTSRETYVGATFNIVDPATQTPERQQNETDTEVSREAVCKLPFQFVPTVVCMGVLNFLLVLLCIYLTCRLARTSSNRSKKPMFY